MQRQTLVAEANLPSNTKEGDRGWPLQPSEASMISHIDVGATSPRKDPQSSKTEEKDDAVTATAVRADRTLNDANERQEVEIAAGETATGFGANNDADY